MNRLAQETSPYLQQHKENPVDWYPWGEKAFAVAREEDKPILLSIGYAACHWCHVMAHESFEDEETAQVMNELFVNVKVDREERPDVDAIYMEAVQAMSGHGGWPMTMFLTPDGRPFYGGTYFPNRARQGLPSFVQVLHAVAEAWQQRRDEIEGQAEQLTAALGRAGDLAPSTGDLPGRETLAAARDTLASRYDRTWGGFGPAPKFPQPDLLELLLRQYAHDQSDETLGMVTNTLDAMASGGMYDHVGGGFHRYSVDARWLVPHFEKMLYDQALLARVYLHAWQVTGEPRYLQVASETIDYVRRDLRHPEGGFFSSEDADSEGEEGKFYVWQQQEIEEVLGDLAPEAIAWWGVTPEGNFENTTILTRPERGDLDRPQPIEEARRRLYEAREHRVRPGLDDKVLTEWNGLFLATLAEAAGTTGRSDWLDDARTAGEFLLRALRRHDGRWLRSWMGPSGPSERGTQRSPRANHLAYAADYAALVSAFTRLAEASGEARWISVATETADAMIKLFWDDKGGGLFTNGHDAERLITRSKDIIDNAVPSANGVAAVSLLRLGALVGNDEYRQRAEAILRLVAEPVHSHPTAFAHLLAAVDLITGPLTEVAVVGLRPDLAQAVQRRYLPNSVLAWGEPYPSPLFEGRADGLAYVCQHYACQRPVDSVDDLLAQLTS